MIAENLYHANLKISGDGLVTLESAWRLVLADPAETGGQLMEEARAWAGAVGDPFRIPQPDGSYEFSERLFVTAIEFRAVNAASCRVIYSGIEFEAEEPVQPVAAGRAVDTFASDGSRQRSMRFRAPSCVDDALIPKPGELLEWDGGAFACVSCIVTAPGEPCIEFEVTAREVTKLQLGLPERGVDADGFETCGVAWFVNCEEYEALLAAHPVGGAEAWAGERFLLVSIGSKPFGKVGYEVALLARKVETRCISKVRTEKFAGLTRAGAIRREIVWNARWRVAAEELPTFFGQTGTFPGDWPEPDCLITSVMPKRLSEMEYEVTVEAQHRSNPDLLQYYSIEDRSDLANRTDIAVDMADFHLTAAMAGYQKLPDGHYMPIPNWNALAGCPFRSESKLPANMIDLTLRCLVVTVSIYVSGGVKSRIAELAAWTQGRVTNAAVEGIEGSFLRIRQTCKETFDDSGKLYTRITRSYQKAPGDYIWSTNYWETH